MGGTEEDGITEEETDRQQRDVGFGCARGIEDLKKTEENETFEGKTGNQGGEEGEGIMNESSINEVRPDENEKEYSDQLEDKEKDATEEIEGTKKCKKSLEEKNTSGLPSGWSRLCVTRKDGIKRDYYLVNQKGQKFRSQKEVNKWLLEHDQDLHVSLKPESANTTLKQGHDIRKMFNKVDSGSKRPSLKAGDLVSGQEEALPSREESLGKGYTKSPEPPIKRKRGRPKKTQSSTSNSTTQSSSADKTGEKKRGKPEEVDQGRSRRVRKVIKPVVDEEEEEDEETELDSGETDKPKACKKCSGCVRSKGCKKVARWNKKQREEGDLAKKEVKRSLQDIDKQVEDDGQLLTEEPEKENIDPSKGKSSVKRAKKTKNESSSKEEVDAAQDDVSEAGSDDIDVVNESYLEEIAKFMEATKLGLVPDPPTKGDGNCWYRAVAEQVIVMI